MANIKITDLTAYTDPESTDVLPIVDVTNDETKKVSIADLMENAGTGAEATPGIAFDGDPNTGIYSPGADQIAISTGGTQRLAISATGAVTIPGNLTVQGTTTFIDSQTLQVEDKNIEMGVVTTPTDTTADGGGITLKGATDKTINWVNATDAWTSSERFSVPLGAQATPSLTFTGDANTGIYSPGADQVAISTGGTARLYINSSGQVGIGNTPEHPLDVSGTIRVKGTTDATLFIDSASGSKGFVYWRERTVADRGILGFANGSGDLVYRSGAYDFSSGTERLRIDSSGRLLVGTSTSASTGGESQYSKLQVRGNTFSAAGHGILSLGRGVGAADIDANLAIGFISFSDNTGGEFAYISCNADADAGTNDYPGRLVFSTTADGASSPTERMRIHSTGQVEIKGGAFSVAMGGTGYQTIFRTGANEDNFITQGASGATIFRNHNGAQHVRIDSSGRVGIGTSIPYAKLQIGSSGNFSLTANTYTGDALILEATASTAGVGQYGQGIVWARNGAAATRSAAIASVQTGSDTDQTGLALFTHTSSSAGDPLVESVRIDHAGRVGIGSTTVDNKLQVVGDIGIGDIGTSGTYDLYWAPNTAGGSVRWFRSESSAFSLGIGTTAGTTEQLRVDGSGRLLVGTSSTSTTSSLTIEDNSASSGPAVLRLTTAATTPSDGNNLGIFSFGAKNHITSASIVASRDGGTWTAGSSQPSRLEFSTTADGASSPTERVRIDRNGYVYMGDGSSGSLLILPYTSNGGHKIEWNRVSTSSITSAATFRNGGSTVGSITYGSASTAYNTSSDYRLKENVTAVTDGITRLQQLKPSRFNFIADPDKTVDGFLAHEVQTIVPEAITGEKDAVDDEGNPQYQGIDQSKLVPLLTAALQEAIGEIESLKARVAALESN